MANIEELMNERIEKVRELRANGVDPYPARAVAGIDLNKIIGGFESYIAAGKAVCVRGRIMGLRKQGGLAFCDLAQDHARIQVLIKKDAVPDFGGIVPFLDIGDFIAVEGMPMTTKAGEKTIAANTITILTKSLRPLPSTWYGLKDVEERYRRRYIDFTFNPEAYEHMRLRVELTKAIRSFLFAEGFLEFETPVLQAIAGGATARPFETYSNALDIPLYLRVAPELFLKRLLVGGFDKVFEIAKNFRNEGIDREHYPEFTMLELYWAYQDYQGLMSFVERFIGALLPALKISDLTYNGAPLDFSGVWPRIPLADFIRQHSGIDIAKDSVDAMKKYLADNHVVFDPKSTRGELADEIFKKAVRPKIANPTFVTHHSKEISPLAKSRKENPEETERFQLIIAGREVVNGFSELNDPIDQRERMEAQEKLHREGHEEASRMDDDFIEALEYGMPPAAGLGIGVDRLAAILANCHSIRDVIAFPTLKPRRDPPAQESQEKES